MDFFQYFEATNKILKRDRSLFCVSAWNDNGKVENIKSDPGIYFATVIISQYFYGVNIFKNSYTAPTFFRD